MARPVQLRYNDATDGETIIGTYLTGDNLINQFQMKNSGSGEYTRVELLADLQFRDNIPIDYSQYATARNGESEPEVLVYAWDVDNEVWTLRDRVFPEKKGVLDDDGKYRNDELWGFQKWVGRKRVTNISETNATITTIVNSLLPSGYVADTPGDDTVPTIDNYSFNGKIDKAIRDLVRDYPVKIWFTSELDSNNDYKVKVRSKGYGGVVETVTFDTERQDSGYQVLEFDEEDKSNIVNKVTIEGIDQNDGTKISETVEDSTSIADHGERSIYRHVGYLEDATQATNIANDILNPDPSPHATISIPFQDQNILNASIDILDDRFGIDAVYTVVKQRDFYTDSKTEVELGFEKNRSEERRARDRDLDEQNHRLFPSATTDVGNQSLEVGDASAQTTSTSTNDYDNGKAQTTSSSSLDSFTLGLGSEQGSNNGTITTDPTGNITYNYTGNAAEFRIYEIEINSDSGNGDVVITLDQGGNTVWSSVERIFGNSDRVFQIPFLPTASFGNTVTVEVEDLAGFTSVNVDSRVVAEAPNATISTSTADSGHGGKGQDGDHNISTSTGTSDSGHGSSQTDPHGGSTEANVNVTTAQEDKTDR